MMPPNGDDVMRCTASGGCKSPPTTVWINTVNGLRFNYCNTHHEAVLSRWQKRLPEAQARWIYEKIGNGNPSPPGTCNCPIRQLMVSGCKCGGK